MALISVNTSEDNWARLLEQLSSHPQRLHMVPSAPQTKTDSPTHTNLANECNHLAGQSVFVANQEL